QGSVAFDGDHPQRTAELLHVQGAAVGAGGDAVWLVERGALGGGIVAAPRPSSCKDRGASTRDAPDPVPAEAGRVDTAVGWSHVGDTNRARFVDSSKRRRFPEVTQMPELARVGAGDDYLSVAVVLH